MLPETYFTYYSVVLAIMVIVPSYYETEKLVGVSNFIVINILWLMLIILGTIGGCKIIQDKGYDGLTQVLIITPPIVLLFEFGILIGSYNSTKAILKAKKKLP